MVDGAGSVPDGAVVIKVAVVDDGPLVLDGLTTILGAIADIEVIATATDGGRRDRPRRTTRWGSRCAVARCAHAPYGLVYPESELLFDHREAGALELHVLGQQPSGADGDVNLPEVTLARASRRAFGLFLPGTRTARRPSFSQVSAISS